MKTTISIADDLLERAKTRASEEKKTLRAVVEEALRLRLAEGPPPAFHLRRHAFKGKGLQPGIAEGNWEQLRDLIYRSG
jgi:toxin-antitoxin system PIN domain toxin